MSAKYGPGPYGRNRNATSMGPYAPGGELPPLGSGPRYDWRRPAHNGRGMGSLKRADIVKHASLGHGVVLHVDRQGGVTVLLIPTGRRCQISKGEGLDKLDLKAVKADRRLFANVERVLRVQAERQVASRKHDRFQTVPPTVSGASSGSRGARP